ncbi:MAG: cell division topological specificity factor MinE [Synergistaceae bacterium]|nr:cell division topological specificity factor MinE [Synergistaceae bacterium]
MNIIKKILELFSTPDDPKEKLEASAKKAKERLQFIIIDDRTGVSPELLEILRNEMIKVLKKYMDIDESRIEIDIENSGKTKALAVNIPVIQVKRGSSITGSEV